MGLIVDSTLDFLPETATPATPSTGAKLWVKSDGTLHLVNVAGVDKTAMTIDQRGPAGFYYAGTGTPTGLTGMLAGDYCTREIDGEVFEYISGAWVDQGFSEQGVNGVTGTLTRVSLSTNPSVTVTGTFGKVPYATVVFDPGSNWNAGSTRYVCPTAGYYRVSATTLAQTTAADTFVGLVAYKNGAVDSGGTYEQIAASENYDVGVAVDTVIQCAAGDYLELYVNSLTNLSVGGGAPYAHAEFQLLAPLTQTPVAPNTGARAYRNAALTLTSGAFTKISIDTVSTDPGGHMDVVTNHRYNVSRTGLYQVNASTSVNSTATGQQLQAALYHNGAAASYGTLATNSVAVETLTSELNDLVYCVAGDYLELWAYCSSALVWNTGSAYGFLSIVQVDQPVPGPSNTGWFTPTFLNSWSGNVQYMKDALGFVHFKGAISGGSSNTQAFALPVGFRPGTAGNRPVVSNSSTASPSYVYMDYNGQVTPVYPSGTGTSYFDGIAPYLAEN
jgi:hypothetical protein